ncbi:MAG: dTMP kinase [Bdellovibrionales bacterium]|nr:dTMP kinase [Bdellovibrionales bacterium]
MIINYPETYSFEKTTGFIVIEGVNGAGKTTLQNKIAQYLTGKNKEFVLTREPGSSAVGKILRPLILDPPEKLTSRTELFLFAADRSQHVERVIRPALADKKIVVSDRYYYSTEAFQGYGRGLDKELVATINSIAINSMIPDLVILLDLDPTEGILRNKSGEKSLERDSFEDEQTAFHQRLRDGFLRLAESLPEPFLLINAAQSPENIFNELLPVLENFITKFENQ